MRLGFFVAGAAGDSADDGAAGAAARAAFAAAGAVLIRIGRGTEQGRGAGAGAAAWDAILVVGAVPSHADPDADRAIDAFARAGGPVLAIGAGVRVLCGLGHLPGRVNAREDAAGAPAPSLSVSHVRVEGRPTPFTSAIPAGRVLRPSAALPAPLDWQLPDAPSLAARGQVIFRACDAAGGTRGHSAIAGVSNERGNVVGLLPAAEISGGEGEQLLRSLRLHLRGPR